ncbi:10234_t:CDS:2, partial [Paraglomus occultum]
TPPKGILDVIKDIQSNFHPRVVRSANAPLLSELMPLQERPMENAIGIVVGNVQGYLAWTGNKNVAKTESTFLVCSGTAGIGKTRYGQELFGTLQSKLSPAAQEKGFDFSPCYYYMLLDFSNGVSLGLEEEKLSPEIILGLRLAYSYFIQGKYQEQFPEFRFKALNYFGYFTITNVIIAIRNDLGLQPDQEFFLFLHVDEYQLCLAGTKPPTEDGLSLFKEMMHRLGHFMSGATRPSIIQTFLSGTAQQEVTQSAKPTFYSFHFLSCPVLSLGARYNIMGHFAKQFQVPCRKWMPKMPIFHLLSDTGGLPHAVQFLLEEFFGRQLEKANTFFDDVENINKNIDRIFTEVAKVLDSCYSIPDFAREHQQLVHALVLERDTHTILNDCEEDTGKVLVQIPFFFLYLYNNVIRDIQDNLEFAFLMNWKSNREWKYFEQFIAEYEVYRTNLLVSHGYKTMTLGEIYQGAIG